MPNKIDETGNRYGRLKVLKEAGLNKNNLVMWLCRCDCGEQTIVSGHNLRRGRTNSCGCLQKERVLKSALKHGHSRVNGMSPTYLCWTTMIQRCTNPRNTNYHRYGQRGIQVCKQWRNDFTKFLKDMGERPSIDYCLSRIDHDDDYKPGNVEWGLKSDNLKEAANRLWSKQKTK